MKSRSEVVSSARANKRFRTIEEKRRIVEETLQPGASVTAVARAHGVNRDQPVPASPNPTRP